MAKAKAKAKSAPRKLSTVSLQEAMALREHAGLPDDVAAQQVVELLDHMGGDWDLAMSAMTMKPRPDWVSEMLGLHPEREVGS